MTGIRMSRPAPYNGSTRSSVGRSPLDSSATWGTRLRPGPLAFIALAFVLVSSTALRAHDPGLSSLDVNVSGDSVSLSLALAAADVTLLRDTTEGLDGDVRPKLRELARGALHLSVDGKLLEPRDDHVSIEDGSARIVLSFTVPRSRDRVRRLTVSSEVPKAVARGHRELLTVSASGQVSSRTLLDADNQSVTVDLEGMAPRAARAWSFLLLGIRHILSGYDHLVFLAGLLLVSRTARELVGALTAFTASHSVSLALVVVGGVHAPASIVEPLIAVSIAWIGVENLLRPQRGARWFVVFGFGLVHGFGFAGALMELGFGASVADMALALLSFNAGVESGQLAAAAAMLPVVWMMRARPSWRSRLLPACSLLIAAAGTVWLIERL